MIEDVEEVRAELQLETLSHGEMLAEREVPDLVARPLQSVAPDVAKRSQRRIVVQAGIEKHQLSRGRHASGRETEIRTLRDATHAAVGVRKVSIGIEHRKPVSARYAGNSGDLPSSDQLVREAAGLTHKFLSAPEW